MPAIRVMVVDDSVVIRKVLGEALATDPSIEVVGSAADGNIALAKIPQINPDLITLDVEMPGKSGIETLVEIRKLYPKLPVIMFSTLTERGAAVTLDALSLGASDYVTKPSNTGSLEQTRAKIQAELIPKIKVLCRRTAGQSQVVTPPARPAFPRAASIRTGLAARVDVLAIGTSTGGPNALAAVLPGLAKEFPVPIVLVQHMPPVFTRLLAERLNKQSQVEIREGEEGELLKPGLAWIAPGDFHMKVARSDGKAAHLRMSQEPPENSCRPAVDVLFRSVAQAYGPNVLAVVLTGMGSDGVRGSEEIKAAGGQVIVQDEATSVVWGMPGQTAAAGCADGIFPLAEIAGEIERRVQSSRMGLEWKDKVKVGNTGAKLHG
ncbi:MAG TPA: chemotaxis response regulator protein-glutamate methylesterase [Candidatus Acidoferrum sp.]|nr:chemotaxis response regulator protein-glutamate methylesterase [Candidatus Acidoferrum sp.]